MLYEINQQLDELLSRLEVDEETGEVTEEQLDLMAEIDRLQMERQSLLEYLAKKVLNLRSEQAGLKAEEERLKKRRDKLASAETSIMGVLGRECGGTKTDLGVATVRYKQTERTNVTDENAAIQWLYSNHHGDCVKVALPTVNKDAVKRLIKTGATVPGVKVETTNNCSLK